jgi:hypothetical protein
MAPARVAGACKGPELARQTSVDANLTRALSKAIASMITEITLAEHNRLQDFLPFGL